MPAAATRPPYQTGDKIRALYYDNGTALGPVEVTAVEPREDGRWHITAKHPVDDGREIGYTVGRSGTSDYVSGRQPDFALLAEHRATLSLLGYDETSMLVISARAALDCLNEDIAGTDSPEETTALRAAVAFVESCRPF